MKQVTFAWETSRKGKNPITIEKRRNTLDFTTGLLFQAVLEDLENLGNNDGYPELQNFHNSVIMAVCRWLADQQTVTRELFSARLAAGFGLNASKEVVTVFCENDKWHVILGRRPPNDPDYPNEPYHSFGKIMLKGKPHQEQIAALIQQDELGMPLGKLTPIGTIEFSNSSRGKGKKLPGHWLCLIFAHILPHRPTTGTFNGEIFPVNALPQDIIPDHREILADVLQFLETGIPNVYREVR